MLVPQSPWLLWEGRHEALSPEEEPEVLSHGEPGQAVDPGQRADEAQLRQERGGSGPCHRRRALGESCRAQPRCSALPAVPELCLSRWGNAECRSEAHRHIPRALSSYRGSWAVTFFPVRAGVCLWVGGERWLVGNALEEQSRGGSSLRPCPLPTLETRVTSPHVCCLGVL